MEKLSNIKYRYESFGGIIALDEPALLAYVDKNYMLELDLPPSPLWEKQKDYLSAPTEVHFSVTNQCPVKCRHCYMDSGDVDKRELSLKDFKNALDILSRMKVFHIALGGGESFTRKDFFEIAEYARKIGIVPNLTTNGYYINEEIANWCRIFGQINVSIDAVGIDPSGNRALDHFSMADKAIELLKKAGNNVGINCVISKSNFRKLKNIFEYAMKKNLIDIEFLRFKPAGRGKLNYYKMKLDDRQNRELYPYLLSISKRYGVSTKIDCSFVPMMCYHKPSKETMEQFAVYGCDGGNVLLGVRSNGKLTGCSFVDSAGESIMELEKIWDNSTQLWRFRKWVSNAPPPCCGCKYLNICKGGCHAVAEFETGSFAAPDPACPMVIDYNQDIKGGCSFRM